MDSGGGAGRTGCERVNVTASFHEAEQTRFSPPDVSDKEEMIECRWPPGFQPQGGVTRKPRASPWVRHSKESS